MREIVFDTETTGLDPVNGHRLVEIGCIELLNRFPSGKTFHRYFNPERDVPAEHSPFTGLSVDFSKSASVFSRLRRGLLDFPPMHPWSRKKRFSTSASINARLEKCAKKGVAASGWWYADDLAQRKTSRHPNRSTICAR